MNFLQKIVSLTYFWIYHMFYLIASFSFPQRTASAAKTKDNQVIIANRGTDNCLFRYKRKNTYTVMSWELMATQSFVKATVYNTEVKNLGEKLTFKWKLWVCKQITRQSIWQQQRFVQSCWSTLCSHGLTVTLPGLQTEKEGLGCSTGELCFIEIERGGKVLSFAKEDMKWGGTHRVHLATAFLHTWVPVLWGRNVRGNNFPGAWWE